MGNCDGVVVLISANAEWRAVIEALKPDEIVKTKMGETFLAVTGDQRVRYFHGGWGKISAAATTQYVIDQYRPGLLVNLGTCGGIAGRIERGMIILVTETVVYDILEQMGDPQEALKEYTTQLGIDWLEGKDEAMGVPIRRARLVSADRDIAVEDIPRLVENLGAVAADWESGAIAWVAKRNGVRCLILRGVTDLVGADGGEAYGNIALFHANTYSVMKTLLEQLPAWLSRVVGKSAGGI